MRRITAGLASSAVAVGLAATVALSASAAPPAGKGEARAPANPSDNLPNAAEEKRAALRQVAIQKVIDGQAKVEKRGASEVVNLGPRPAASGAPRASATEDQYVELAREKTDKIFVILAEFGNQRQAHYPDQDTDPATPGPTRFDGPLHNQIPAPDRTKDNSTVWQPDYDADHYRQLYFGEGDGVESLKTYYEKQSSGRYSVDGMVTDWVKVPYNEARYGRSNGYPCDDIVCDNTWALIRDAVHKWNAEQKAAGKSSAQIRRELQSFDQWDRNDYDGDGNFNEPDGYIDHFQIVHAGGDQADGDPIQGEDAIWSHRWKAYQNNIGTTGPSFNKDGGTPIGSTGLWVADYTIQPENGGLSVFTHEYGHDLGLPDEYDTSVSTDNAVSWWSLMAQSRVSAAGDEGIGTRPADLGAWDKLQLGWLDYEIVPKGNTRTLDLGPHEYNSAKAQGVVVPLGKKAVTTEFGAPFAGAKQWWSGMGNGLANTMTRQVTLPAGTSTLTFKAHWNIEDCGSTACDYAYVQVDDGTGYKAIRGSITNKAEGNGIDGYVPDWRTATFDLTPYAGKTISLRFLYRTDGAARGTEPTKTSGLFVDDLAITNGGSTLLSDGAESSPNGWTLNGFRSVGTSETNQYDHYYIASNRAYVSYDKYLQTGPYNFGFPAKPDFVEHFPYQNGLLVSYWDTAYEDNNETDHPGNGLILPIDAHPQAIYKLDGKPWRGRIQTYDSTFGLEKADSFTLHDTTTGQGSLIRGQDAVPVFDDMNEFYDPALPYVGVKVPHAGVRMQVQSQDGTSMRVALSPSPAG
jgi:immune inhibitor A